ncbi:MAG TPA: CoA transferase [Actinomycetota bacterium]|jgi:crotonobetainyl-CoA:carnitine CoA-transferase CaiB-like acyl-CoA transferase
MRVLDLTDEAGVFATRILVGLGADVVRPEPPGGDPMRAWPGGGIAFAHWNAGKRSATADRRAAVELAGRADVVVESTRSGTASPWGLDPGELRRRFPRLVHVVVTPFGLTGPRAAWRGSDMVGAAAGGMMWMSGRADGPPLVPPREQAYHLAGANAAIGALLGLAARRRTGLGQLVDVSVQECVASTLEYGALLYIHRGEVHRRDASRYPHVPHRLFRARDGFVAGGYGGSPRMWTDLVAWMAEHDAASGLDGPEWSEGGVRFAARDRIDVVVEAFSGRFGKDEFAEEAERRRLPWAAVDGPHDVAANPQLEARRFFVDVEVGERVLRDVGFAVRGSEPPPEPLREDEPAAPWPVAPAASPPVRPTSSQPALWGVRVLDLTWVLAGPYATKILADHGADVVKVESRHRPDPTRFSGSMHLTAGDGPLDPDRSGYFNNFNRNKRGIVLNLRTPEGLRLLARLVPHCDVVVENFSAGLLERWGLGFRELRTLRPDVILVRMAGMGQTGPWRDRVTYADALAAAAGITAETGSTADDPVGVAFGLGDMVAAVHAVAGVLEALDHRDRTGEGREIDLSQLEAMASHTGTALLESQAGVASLSYDGNRHPRMAPHGAYRCEGDDRWVAIATATDDEWRALCATIGRGELADDPRFADLASRKAQEDELDALVAEWTRTRSPWEAAERLQAAGVAAAPVEDGRDLVEGDAHLRERGFYVTLDHPAAGPVRHEGVAVRLATTPGGVSRPAPRLGEHTTEVLTELLGMSPSEIEELTAAGVLE